MKKILFLICACTLFGCKKYLDYKPDQSIVTPQTIQDLQSILNNNSIMNAYSPFTGELGCDDYYLYNADWLPRTTTERNAYVWERDLFNDAERNDWSLPYVVVYYANVVLDELAKEKYYSNQKRDRDNIRGQALFFRAFSYYNLLQVFSKPYSADSASADLGIALRLSPDPNIATTRASLKDSYDRVVSDLVESVDLLPMYQPYVTMPSKLAAIAMLARVNLTMGLYSRAQSFAADALQMNGTLIDYNTVNGAATLPFARFNAETSFHSVLLFSNTLNSVSKIDTVLYRSYAPNDLRRSLFFRTNTDGSVSFRGSYDGSTRLFNGLSNDELYLIAAECSARNGDKNGALDMLNRLLLKRWKTSTYVPIVATDAQDALTKILIERRKELVLRGQRWADLRRLNKETLFAKSNYRFINNKLYTLYPNDKRYILPIPNTVITMTGMQQNEL